MTDQPTGGQGALARVIATRGGLAAAEAPFVIEHREALIYMLCEAAELEHAIMCQYLFAAFSLKQSTDEGLTAPELEAVDRWRKTISHIAADEMLHLALVQNLLSAVGAAPHFSRPNLPQPAGHYPPGVVLTLLPFGDAALRHFMFLERPEGMDLADAPGLAAAARAAPAMAAGDIVPRLQDFATVGHLYRSIEEGFKNLSATYGDSWLFVGPPEAQASEAHFGWSKLVQVTDLESALRAIETILEQGEGPRGRWDHAHFGLFVEILDEYEQLKGANPDFEPARPVLPAAVRPREGDESTPLIGDEFTARCTDLFNVSYEVLLQALARYFAHTEETEPQLAALAQLTLGLMLNVVRPLGTLVTTLPVGPDAPGRLSGPSFELFYESDYGLPHRDAAWALIEERLREAASFADRLTIDAPPDAAARLQPIEPALLQLAHALATCRADWGGASHAGEVTVAHRRRDAESARAGTDLAGRVDSLGDALRAALAAEQDLGMQAMLSAASMGNGQNSNSTDVDDAKSRLEQKRTLVAACDLHFDHVFNLAEMLVAVVGRTEIQPSDLSNPQICGRSLVPTVTSRELRTTYDDVRRAVIAVPPEALLVDPRPSPTFTPEERQHPLPGFVDQSSMLALIDEMMPPSDDAPVDGPDDDRAPRRDSSTHTGDMASTGVDTAGLSVALLLTDTHLTLLAVLATPVSSERNVVAGRHRLREIATRIRARALRPLAEALCQVGDPAAALEAAGRTATLQETSTVADRLTALALKATELRAGLRVDVPELLEATAALQGLALDYGCVADDDREALLEQFRRCQSDAGPSIQLVRNGPYVLTNVGRLLDRLGDPLPACPQVALCRCGESAAKPFCDGSHARADFTDVKDPKRVANQRDRYQGLTLTVFDNRGTCQHSGYCTDLVPLAFRVDKEPFVAPSGARTDEIIRAARTCPSGALSFAIDDVEARQAVDWNGTRPPAVLVSKDGPYRITGAIPLLEGDGRPVARNDGASLEHYALCRCGHSQNKPFCSGMHWYIQFRDPVPIPEEKPTLYEWCGGIAALTRMTKLFFERYVSEDPLLAPLFADAPPDHPEKLAAWLGEAFGGPRRYSDHYGDHAHLVAAHAGRALSESQRARWVSLLCVSADQVGIPADAEFRAAFVSYLEFESRRLLEQAAVEAPSPDTGSTIWDWSPAGAPQPLDTAVVETNEVDLPEPGQPLSFAAQVRSLFRERDRQSMAFAFDLWSYDAVKEHAGAILDRLHDGTMPCDGPWPSEKVAVFARWIDDGTPP